MASQSRIEPGGFVVIRSPLLPIEDFLTWSSDLVSGCAKSDLKALEASLASDRETLRKRLAEFIRRPEVVEALFVASPDLVSGLTYWQEDPNSKRGARVETALVKYMGRMCARATPFGLFAGCTTGSTGVATYLHLRPREHYRRHVRLDMGYLYSVSEAIESETDRRWLTYFPNSSLYCAAGRIHYNEVRVLNGKLATRLIALEATPYLLSTLELAKSGAGVDLLAEALVGLDVSLSDARSYIRALVDSQILISDLRPVLTGTDALEELSLRTDAPRKAEERLDVLRLARAGLLDLNQSPIGVDKGQYDRLSSVLQALPTDASPEHLFHVDLYKPAESATIGDADLTAIQRVIIALNSLPRAGGTDELSSFKKAFRERYEGQQVALAEALDLEIGIGRTLYTSDSANSDNTSRNWMSYLGERLLSCIRNKVAELVLADAEINEFLIPSPPSLPRAFAAMVSLCARRNPLRKEVSDIVFHYAGGPSGANMLGRFCHGDPTLHAHVIRFLEREAQMSPDRVYAEVVHAPEGRQANVIRRPTLRQYEIPYLGRSGVDREHQLELADLTIAFADDRLVLRSKRLGAEVVPRLSSAHNYRQPSSLPLYRFLGCLQGVGAAQSIRWDWGQLALFAYLPRVRLKDCVVAPAQWRLSTRDCRLLVETKSRERYSLVQWLRRERSIPRLVQLRDGDNTLLVDLENVLSIEALVSAIRPEARPILSEFYPPADELVVSGPEGTFVSEVILPFLTTNEVRSNREQITVEEVMPDDRVFPPGSAWLYVKLYAGPATLERVLTKTIAPLASKFSERQLSEEWFFVRYRDPDSHLRVRFRGSPERLRNIVWPELSTALDLELKARRVTRVQIDTYTREIERYGGLKGVCLAERLFHVDSTACAAMLAAIGSEASAADRQLLCVFSVAALLRSFGVDAKTLIEWFEVFRPSESLMRRVFAREYRACRKAIMSYVQEGVIPSPEFAGIRDILFHRSVAIEEIAGCYRALLDENQCARTLRQLVLSFAHMNVNRLLRLDQVLISEARVYDFLRCSYESVLARQAKQKGVSAGADGGLQRLDLQQV
jgi:thiopeptide-type bacteriocin biosynthesis protein